VTRDIAFPTAVGRAAGYLARPDTAERLPAVLLIPGEGGLDDWMRENARDLSSIGYVVLAVERSRRGAVPADLADEQTLAELSAAVRWLRRRPDVLPDRVGVVGWSRGGGEALAVAASMSLEACAVCDGPLAGEPALLNGLRRTPVLVLLGGEGRTAREALPAFRKALAGAVVPPRVRMYEGAGDGFMGPPGREGYARHQADRAYVELYEFLGKYVEDAALAAGVPSPAEKEIASIADLMRAVNSPGGVRGVLIRDLEKEPATPAAWDRVRANAALVAEAGNLLGRRTPPKGSHSDWQEQARAFTAAAERLATAADRRDYAGARRGLADLAARCAVCHREHR
jgi:dienelactone hydrolase